MGTTLQMKNDNENSLKTLPSLNELKDTGCVTEDQMTKYAETISKAAGKNGFEHFKAHRRATFGKLLPIFTQEFVEEAEREKIQNTIDQIKKLGFFSEGYIDNLIIYFETLKAPLLGSDYLTNIIDKYIKPDIRVQGIRPFQKFAIGYLCNELKKYGATIRPLSTMMENHFILSPSEIENAIRDYKPVLEYAEQNESAYFIADLIGIMLLYHGDFYIEENLSVFGNHHHAQSAKEKFLTAYKNYSKRVAITYIPLIQSEFVAPPYFLDKIILPELKEYITTFNPDKCKNLDINMLAGIILSATLLSVAPKLINNKEKLLQLGWIKE
jgi:hypothetical protein